MNGPNRESSQELSGIHGSYWLGTAEPQRYPSLDHALHVDAAVVGGGITGITAALLLKRAGLSVALLEAGTIASGVTGFTTAKITSLHTLIYHYLISSFGEERARQYAEANQAGLERIASLVEEYAIPCDFARRPFLTFAQTPQARGQIEAEVKAASRLGLPASFVESVPVPEPSHGAVRFENQAQFHPVKYLSALADRISGDGSRIFERSRVVDITEGDIFQAATEIGSVNARFLVVATHFPVHDKQGFYFARLHQSRHYAAAVRIPDRFPEAMYIGSGVEERSYRAQPHGEGEVVIVSAGGEHKTGQAEDTREFFRSQERFVTKSYPGSEVLYRWSSQAVVPVDRVPYIGRMHAGNERLFTATGFGAWGMAAGTAAAMILTDMITGKANPWAPVFDPGRFTPGASAKEFLSQNLNVGKEFVKGHLGLGRGAVSEVRPGEGRVIQEGGKKIGVYRDEAGAVHAVHAVCTHMGCTVAWNSAEKSWDCPCHGSRFSQTGEVLNSPAVEDLERIGPHEPDR